MSKLDDPIVRAIYERVKDKIYETSDHVQAMEQLISSRRQAGTIDAHRGKGKTPLFYAIKCRQNKTARLLVEAGADPFRFKDKHSPLRLALSGLENENTVSFVLWLLRRLAEQGLDDQIARRLNSPFGFAHRICTETLLPQYTALKMILEHGANPNSSFNNNLHTGLHMAARKGQVPLIRLLARHGADVNFAIKNGVTPLHMAATKGHADAALALLAAGASPDTPTGDANEKRPVKNNKTAADLADICGHHDVANVIRDWQYWHGPATVTPAAAASS